MMVSPVERSDLCDLCPAVMAARVRRCGDAACQRHHARAGGGLVSIFAKCLSPAAGRGNTGLWALPLTGGPRSYVSAGGTLEDAGMWASSPAHRAIWIREQPDGVPPAAAC